MLSCSVSVSPQQCPGFCKIETPRAGRQSRRSTLLASEHGAVGIIFCQQVTKALREATHRWLGYSNERILNQVLRCSAWRWWLPTHTRQEQERMLDAALAAQPFEEAMGTEFANL